MLKNFETYLKFCAYPKNGTFKGKATKSVLYNYNDFFKLDQKLAKKFCCVYVSYRMLSS
jgi:hypothetical protein